ncbi:type I-E CRISPR-associated protein Cse2/CasB [Streptomyces sp. NPDC086023]|uniref:type I-E CRISPR-associated protein Cse2/CasB n=1 Tax=Streptomyces sp. NPDC086023 TaxID=3365746 RepID=UPI0037D378CB
MTTPATPALPRGADGQQRAERFVRDVLGVCAGSKGAQADLRSGLGLPYDRCQRMHRHLVRLMPDTVQVPQARRHYYAVAALIAARSRRARDEETERATAGPRPHGTASQPGAEGTPSWWERPNLGASLAEAVNRGLIAARSAESELHLLARVGSDSVHTRLPALIGQITGRGVELDWAVLLHDLTGWDYRQDRIATRWLEAYFRVRDRHERSLTQPPESGADRNDSQDETPQENQ